MACKRSPVRARLAPLLEAGHPPAGCGVRSAGCGDGSGRQQHASGCSHAAEPRARTSRGLRCTNWRWWRQFVDLVLKNHTFPNKLATVAAVCVFDHPARRGWRRLELTAVERLRLAGHQPRHSPRPQAQPGRLAGEAPPLHTRASCRRGRPRSMRQGGAGALGSGTRQGKRDDGDAVSTPVGS